MTNQHATLRITTKGTGVLDEAPLTLSVAELLVLDALRNHPLRRWELDKKLDLDGRESRSISRTVESLVGDELVRETGEETAER